MTISSFSVHETNCSNSNEFQLCRQILLTMKLVLKTTTEFRYQKTDDKGNEEIVESEICPSGYSSLAMIKSNPRGNFIAPPFEKNKPSRTNNPWKNLENWIWATAKSAWPISRLNSCSFCFGQSGVVNPVHYWPIMNVIDIDVIITFKHRIYQILMAGLFYQISHSTRRANSVLEVWNSSVEKIRIFWV